MSLATRTALLTAALAVFSLVAVVAPADAGTPPTTGTPEIAVLTVTKVVQGEAPDDAEFVIEVDCENSGTTELSFGSEGGSEDVIFFDVDFCTISETQTGGAVDVTPPSDVAIAAPIQYAATVTNVFDMAPASDTSDTGADTAVRPTFTG